MMVEQVWLDDLKLHDVTDPAWPIALRDANFGSSPEPRAASEPRPSAHGSVNRTRFWGPRLLELVGYVSDVTPHDTGVLLEQLRAHLALGHVHTLRFRPVGSSEELELTVVAASKLDAPVSGWAQILRWGVTLEAPDPRMYVVGWIELGYDPGLSVPATVGLPLPLEFPLVFGAEAGGGSPNFLAATNPGSASTPVILSVSGPADVVSEIRNETSGKKIAFSLIGLDVGEEIVVDTGAKTALLNGAAAPWLIDASENTWFELDPGENVLSLVGSGFVADQTRLGVRYRIARF